MGGFFYLQAIIDFIDEGGNVLLTGSQETTDLIRELGTEVGVEMDEEGAVVIDHLNYDAQDKGQVRSYIIYPIYFFLNFYRTVL